MHFPLFLCLYESFWKGFESDQRRLTLLLSNAFACLARLCFVIGTTFEIDNTSTKATNASVNYNIPPYQFMVPVYVPLKQIIKLLLSVCTNKT